MKDVILIVLYFSVMSCNGKMAYRCLSCATCLQQNATAQLSCHCLEYDVLRCWLAGQLPNPMHFVSRLANTDKSLTNRCVYKKGLTINRQRVLKHICRQELETTQIIMWLLHISHYSHLTVCSIYISKSHMFLFTNMLFKYVTYGVTVILLWEEFNLLHVPSS